MLRLTADARADLARFVSRVLAAGSCWILADADGRGAWVESNDEALAAGAVVPVHLLFSDRAYARRVAVDEWADHQPRQVPLAVLLEEVLPSMAAQAHRVGCNFQRDLTGLEVDPDELRRSLLGAEP